MKFQNPEIFYLLFLLLIPIIIHLFQLQKFVKTPFTNVAFLTKIVQDNRKSSRLKKWLILAIRSLFLLALLFTFAQPYFSNLDIDKKQHTFIYLDNSLSMKAKGERGELLQQAIQEIIENASKNSQYSLLTNDRFYDDLNYVQLKEVLIQLDFTAKTRDINTILLKIKEKTSKKTNALYNNLLISDFQSLKSYMFTDVTNNISLIKLKSNSFENISVDSVYVESLQSNTLDLKVTIKNQGDAKQNIPIAVYDEETLLSKQTFDIKSNEIQSLEFTLPKREQLSGIIKLTFSDTFPFDNSFYFSSNHKEKKRVLSIGSPSNFLHRIYTEDEFNYQSVTLDKLDYNSINKQEIILLNELSTIPTPLSKKMQSFINSGGVLICIPNKNSNLVSYTNFLKSFNTELLYNENENDLKITSINYEHPLLENTFSKKVANFQYPTLNNYYTISSPLKSRVLNLENREAFLSEINVKKGKLFVFSGAISLENSNFQKSPLIVPIFYNFSKYGINDKQLYYLIQKKTNIDIPVQLEKDQVLSLVGNSENFIPLQKNYPNKVSISIQNQPNTIGFYKVTNQKDTIATLAFNTPKEESYFEFLDLDKLENNSISIVESVSKSFEDSKEKFQVKWLWKWFLGLAIVSLLLEIIILTFYKP